ncbi:MAG: hypothetical protein LVR00_03450 [Rhabdochlamydiaceae bacterium]|jgi:hypothetical protein
MTQILQASLLRDGLNALQIGALRMPTFFAQMTAALAVGEIAVRSIKSGLDFVGVPTGGKLATRLSEWTSMTYTQKNDDGEEVKVKVNFLRPYEKVSAQQLATVALVAGLFGNVGATAIDFAFGPAPAIYNRVLSFLGNIRVESGSVHPLVSYVSSFVYKA